MAAAITASFGRQLEEDGLPCIQFACARTDCGLAAPTDAWLQGASARRRQVPLDAIQCALSVDAVYVAHGARFSKGRPSKIGHRGASTVLVRVGRRLTYGQVAAQSTVAVASGDPAPL